MFERNPYYQQLMGEWFLPQYFDGEMHWRILVGILIGKAAATLALLAWIYLGYMLLSNVVQVFLWRITIESMTLTLPRTEIIAAAVVLVVAQFVMLKVH